MYVVLQEGLALANKVKSGYYQGIFFSQMAQYFKKEYQSDSGIKYVQKAIAIMTLHKDWELVSRLKYRMAMFYLDKKDYLNAIKVLDELLRFNNTHNEHSNTGYIYNLMALTFEILEDPINQKKYILKELELAEKHNSDQERLYAYSAWASWLESQRQFKAASIYYNKALKIVKRFQDEEALTETFLSLGNNYTHLKEYKKSFELLLSAEKIALKNQHKTGWNAILSTNYAYLSDLYLATEKPQKALDYAQRSLELLKNDPLRYTYLIRSYTTLINAFKKLGNYQDALKNHERLQELKQTIDIENSREEAKNIEIKYQIQQITAEKEAANNALQIRELRLKNAQSQTIILWTLLGVLIFMLGWGYWYYTKIKIFNRRLSKKKHQLEALNEIKDKLFGIIGHDLRAPVADLTNTISLLETNYPLLKEESSLFAQLSKKTTTLQTLVNNLVYWALSQRSHLRAKPRKILLEAALQDTLSLLNGLIEEKHLSIIEPLNTENWLYIDENHLQIVLYNVLQNAIKFSPLGAAIQIEILAQNGEIEVQITNQGQAFEWNGTIEDLLERKSHRGTLNEKGTGLGLLVCVELVKLNQGNICAFNHSTGTTVVITFPCMIPIVKNEYATF
ncbi:MAG: tetratricopeptide repeat-containing sensor histidine kinase [Spirosomataceae bacterium]